MKKRILSVLLLCCMVLGLLPTTVSAADGPMDTVPKYDVSIDVYNRTSDITIKDSRSYYIYSSVPDKERDTWTWNWKIFIKGDKAAPHIFIDGVNIERSPSSKGPAIELNKKASAYLYFIGRDSTLQGATGRAAIQKNRSEGQVHVLVRTGTTVTCKGGVVTATGHYGAAIGGGRWCRGMDITLTDATLNLSTNYRSNGSDAAAVGYGDIVYKPEQLVADPSIATNDRIKVGSKDGKIVMLTANGHALRTDGKPSYFMHLTDFLIPDSDGMIDLSLLTLPYTQNYGWAITDLDVKMMETSCEGNHTYGWKDWNGCHVWGCTRCPARDPLKSGPAPDGEHIPGEWEIQEKKCTVCGHKLMKDTTPPVIEGITNGMEYTAEDTDDGQPGTISFMVSDPARDKEVSSGVKSVTINGVEQTVQAGQVYHLTAPNGGNNDEGFVYVVVATDNAGNSTTTKITLYRRHRVLILSDRNDPSSAIFHLGVPHGSELELPFDHLPKEAYFVDWDNEDIKISRGENNDYNFGIINSNRKFLLVIPKTELPTLTVRVGNKSFWDYRADAPDEFCYVDPVDKYGEGYAVSLGISSDETSYYFETATRYTLKELKELDDKGSIKWYKYNSESWSYTLIGPSFEDYHGEWYVYAKATNEVGTKYVSSPKLILDCSDPAATVHPSGKELKGKANSSTAAVEGTTYWGNLQFKVHDETPVTVQDGQTVLKPDENGIYTIPADMDDNVYHNIYIRDSCGNTIFYLKNKVRWNTLAHVDTLDEQKLPHGAVLSESLPATVTVRTAASGNQSVSVPVKWDEAADYVPAAKREQHFTVTGTLDLSGMDIVVPPEQEALQTVTVEVTVAGAPQYRVTAASSENGTVTVVNATETAEDGTPLFCKEDLVMLSIAPNEGYMLSTLSINGTPASFAVEDDTYTFAQPEENVTITATFEKCNEHTITFDANGGSEPEDLPEEVTTAMPAKKVLRGSEYSLPECEFIAPEGKQFKAWEIDGTEYPVNAPVTVTADITVKALWEDAPPVPDEYTVRFNANGGGGTMADVTGVSGSYTLPACGFTEPEGKQFKGWSTGADGSVISGTTYEVNSDTTFYAIWESKEYSVIVTDGKATIGAGSEISKAAQGTTITLTANAAPDGKVFDKWVVESGNTTLEDANSETTTFIMPDSEVSVKATYTIPHTHTYDQEIQKPETLKSAADCTNDAVYFKSCSCGEISTTETFTAAGTQLGHAWASDWSKDTDNHWKECSRCHEKKDEAAHDYGSDNICDTCGYDKTVPHTHNLTLVPAKAPTCTEKGNTAYYTCDGCDKWFEDATGASEVTDKTSVILAATGHSASDWKSDNTDHWKECTVVGCGVIIEGSKAAHTAGEWIIDTPATATTSGSKHKECTVCGYTMATETIPATGGGEHTHSYGSEWKNDADNHWHECSCGDKKDTAAHTAGEWIIDTPATATTDGSKHKECTVCSYTMATETIPATGGGEHTHSYGSEWKSDADKHWHECSCGDKKDTAAHTAGEWIIDTPATATTSGSKHKECTVCGYTMATETIPATGGGEHTHSYGSEWKNDADNHWHECSCGDKKDTAAHTAGEWIIDTPATATTSGTKHKKCTVCGYTMTIETIPATGGGEHTHNYSSDWKSDSINHWKECSCGDKADVAAHSFKWVVDKEATATKKGSKHEECKVCGYQRPAVEIPATGSTTKPTGPTGSNPNTGAESPKTGDNSNMILWIAVLFVSGFGVLGTVIYGKKKKEQAE
ncbi:InlB B-repeat-containing protein [Lachnospiraceae bacterium CLA-AA-H215]|uniref:InlB B-repeat-containing protein n=1 Tax=Hominifimenecus microfluidus TaxID=2885348 RepID=A0AAE3EAF2_9FIRM|nr:InlB B-repeat-containing protein [Hominifimenecus microfluidus]MCC2230880.1 InlB B-repeat-containing protein [Hominifimenecus microfluidus]